MIVVDELTGPVYYGVAVVKDGHTLVAVVQPSFRLAVFCPTAGWVALQHSFERVQALNWGAARRAERGVE